jgi:hypothetical protein
MTSFFPCLCGFFFSPLLAISISILEPVSNTLQNSA